MSNYREELAENIENYLIGLDDSFAFKCRGCGKCCKNRDDILLTTRDICNIAKKFNITTSEAISRYCESYIGDNSRIPILRLKPQGKYKVCPLLNDGRCLVHDVKPTVCAIFPLGRVVMNESHDADSISTDDNSIKYIITPFSCGSIKRKQTVRRWLERYSIPVYDEFFIRWNEVITSLINTVWQAEKAGLSEETLNMFWNGIFTDLYINYDPQKEIMPQFSENTAHILKVATTINGLMLNKNCSDDECVS